MMFYIQETISRQKSCAISITEYRMHTLVGEKTSIALAKTFNVHYYNRTPKEVADSIDRLNAAVQKALTTKVKTSIGEISEFAVKYITETDEIAKRRNAQIETYTKAMKAKDAESNPEELKRINEKWDFTNVSEEFPITRMLWHRVNYDAPSKEDLEEITARHANGFGNSYFHGHHGEGTILINHLGFVVNADHMVGKAFVSKPGYYTVHITMRGAELRLANMAQGNKHVNGHSNGYTDEKTAKEKAIQKDNKRDEEQQKLLGKKQSSAFNRVFRAEINRMTTKLKGRLPEKISEKELADRNTLGEGEMEMIKNRIEGIQSQRASDPKYKELQAYMRQNDDPDLKKAVNDALQLIRRSNYVPIESMFSKASTNPTAAATAVTFSAASSTPTLITKEEADKVLKGIAGIENIYATPKLIMLHFQNPSFAMYFIDLFPDKIKNDKNYFFWKANTQIIGINPEQYDYLKGLLINSNESHCIQIGKALPELKAIKPKPDQPKPN